MPALNHTYFVTVTSTLLPIVLMTIRMMARFNQAPEELSQLTDADREYLVTRSP
jgi:hypothetical protein